MLASAGLLAACSGGAAEQAEPRESPSASSTADPAEVPAAAVPRPPTRTEEFLPGLEADVWDPVPAGPGPVVVLIPGGGWVSANRSGLAPLASALSEAAMTVVSMTYRTAADESYYPVPLEEVLCAAAFAAGLSGDADGSGPLVVVGHSAGANLAALAALDPDAASDSCPYPSVAPDAFAGLAGPYDVLELPQIAVSLFGAPAEDEPGAWERGNPLTLAGNRPEVPALLLHGADDPLVPTWFTTAFATALEDGGHEVMVEIVPGADHSGIYRVDVAADRLVDWITALS